MSIITILSTVTENILSFLIVITTILYFFLFSDPAPVFFNYDVQRLLKRLTKPDPKKVFRKKLDGRSVATPEFKFMTDEDLEDAMKTAERRMYYFLQMPPVVKVQSDEVEILSKDPEIKNHDTSKFVFTDITFAVKNQDRLVTVREPDGTLRNANNDERKRMLQVYFPFQGREMFPPKMFDGEYFQVRKTFCLQTFFQLLRFISFNFII